MILGVYWYFGFPEQLYAFRYFTFNRGFGGHADNPAELFTNVICRDSEELIEKMRALVSAHPFCYLFVRRSGHALQISTGGYQLFDYDFKLIEAVDALLHEMDVQPNTNPDYTHAESIRMIGTQLQPLDYPRMKFMQVVGSEKKKSNAETLSLRFDCHLPSGNTTDFIKQIRAVLEDLGIRVFYYYESGNGTRSNLMLFISNGRQGPHHEPPTVVDGLRLEAELEKIMAVHNVNQGHHGDVEYPLYGRRHTELMVDEEFILSENGN